MKEIKVGDKFRGILSRDTVTVVYINAESCCVEYAYNRLGIYLLSNISSYFEEIPVGKVRWFQVFAQRRDSTSPDMYHNLRKSKEEFFISTSSKESDYEWISLKEIEYEKIN